MSRSCADWLKLNRDELDYLEGTVDSAGGTLSHNKWKKLYALFAEVCNRLHKNYRVYLSLEGLLYDTTTHSIVTAEEISDERLHKDALSDALDTAEIDQLHQLKRWKLEIDQLAIKIDQMTDKRKELVEKYDEAKLKFVEML
jgi:hypothetical protein